METEELKPGEEGGGSAPVCLEAGDVGGPEAAKIFFQTSASAFENRSRKILAVACELNDVTAALNIYVIKGRHQLGGRSPTAVVFLRFSSSYSESGQAVSPALEGYRVLVNGLVRKGPLSQELGGGRGYPHTYTLAASNTT